MSVISRGEPKLSGQVKLYPKGLPGSTEEQKQLAKRWPMPTASMVDVYSTETTNHDTWKALREAGINGQLNPTWVEWLQGFPLNWSVLGS